jgi:hypothetical protein
MSPFGGTTYERELDHDRLQTQLRRVREIMLDGRWWTLAELESHLGYPQASVSARIRDLRKEKFGGFEVARRRITGGLFEYRVVLPRGQMSLFEEGGTR